MSSLDVFTKLRELIDESYELAKELSRNGELLGRITRVYPVEVSEGKRVVAIEVSFTDYLRYVSKGQYVGIGSILAILNPLTKCVFLGTVVGYRREDLLSMVNIPVLNPPKDPSTMQTPLILYLDLIAEATLENNSLKEIKPPTTPIEPNSPVFIPKASMIREVLGVCKEGVLLGYLRTGSEVRKDLEVRVPLEAVYHHLLVIGTTGSGKTVLLKNIVLSVINEFKNQNPLIVAFDIQGDYLDLVVKGNSVYEALNELWVIIPVTRSLRDKLVREVGDLSNYDIKEAIKRICRELINTYLKMTFKSGINQVNIKEVIFDEGGNEATIKYIDSEVRLSNSRSFKLRLIPWSPRFSKVSKELSDFIPTLSLQARLFIKDLLSGVNASTIDDVCSDLATLEAVGRRLRLHSSTVNNISRSLIAIKSTGIFDCFINIKCREAGIGSLGSVWFDEPNYDELFNESSNLLVIDLRWCRLFTSSPYAEAVFTYRILDKLFKWKDRALREGRELRPTLIILDEAHNYFPQSTRELMSKEIVEEVINKIMRLGRVRKLGSVFATHQPADLNELIIQLTNTKIALRSDERSLKSIGLEKYYEELKNAPNGYAVLATYVVNSEVLRIRTPPPEDTSHEEGK